MHRQQDESGPDRVRARSEGIPSVSADTATTNEPVTPKRCWWGRSRSRRASPGCSDSARRGRTHGTSGYGPANTVTTRHDSSCIADARSRSVSTEVPTSGCRGGRHSTIVMARSLTSSSMRIWSRTRSGTPGVSPLLHTSEIVVGNHDKPSLLGRRMRTRSGSTTTVQPRKTSSPPTSNNRPTSPLIVSVS